ncbi:MAG: hypothetical protein M3Q89_02985 [Verrucomicrobiota bacterium]|nr:hypothetical protein [Verrucomicrobiota bacterium]
MTAESESELKLGEDFDPLRNNLRFEKILARIAPNPVRNERPRFSETAWNRPRTHDCGGLMGNSQGRDNVKKRARRRKKTERLALAAAKGKVKPSK